MPYHFFHNAAYQVVQCSLRTCFKLPWMQTFKMCLKYFCRYREVRGLSGFTHSTFHVDILLPNYLEQY